ncbi:MAG: phosphate regulon sensor histidine kinase PhoR [Dokdonella sp.]|uniref:phosphate regulon sensor histidine kinase PhoR n=1 Tax=Dokdonella sp. TaxID=2291710 RepID=UPI003F7FF557
MKRRLGRAWRSSGGRLAALFAIAFLAGLWLRALPISLLAACALVLGYGLLRLARFAARLAGPRRMPAADGGGIWDEIENLTRRQQRAAIADKRRMVQRLRAFRDAASALPDAVIALDPGLRIEWFNAAAANLLGLQYPADLGAHLPNLVRAPRFGEWLRRGADEPLPDLPSPADEERRLDLRLIRHADDRSLLVVRDVSQLVRLEQVRRDFVANVSHELRTPLTVVHGYLDMIEPEQVPEYESILHELRSQSRRMTQIVEDLLTLSRLEARNDLPQERIGMRPLLEALRREADALSQGQHTVTTELSEGRDLLGSAKELHSAFSNLVSNAVRYMPAGGRITLRWERDADGGARLAVTDTGQGIPAQHLPRLTERFYRVSTSRSRETGGTGLGLSIVKHVLHLHQARLDIRSEPGVGSTFACVFGSERLLEPLALAHAP